MSRRRIVGIDVARGVASLIMIQGHAYDGWVASEHKASAAYQFTRLLGSLPLPAFLVLAGAAVALRVDAARRRDEDLAQVRRSVMRRGAMVLFYGYATNVVYALMDGVQSVDTVLRADVLHVIGLSIVALAALGIRADRRAFAFGAAALVVMPTLFCPWLSPLGDGVTGPLRWPLALFVDVPGVTRMPFVPLVAWVGLGALVSLFMLRARGQADLRAGAPTLVLGALALGSFVVAGVAHAATPQLVQALGGTLSRAHPAVWLNVIDLGARGVLVLALGALFSLAAPAWAQKALTRLGRGSLVAYVFHIPFCYGRLGAGLEGRLDMVEASLAVVGLAVLSWLAVYARDEWKRRRASSGTIVGGALL